MKKIVLFATLAFVALYSPTNLFAQKSKKHSKIKYIDPANMDKSVKPGDNFFLYANGNWLKENPVPASKTRWGSFDVLAETATDRLRLLAEEAAANPSKDDISARVGNFYASGMDSAAIEAAGYEPISALLQSVYVLNSKKEVLQKIATLRSQGVSGLLFNFNVSQDDKNVNAYIPQLGQGGTSLPDRDYYLKNDARSKAVRSAYENYLADLFRYTGSSDAEAVEKANNILQLEIALAKIQRSRVEMRNPVKTYNKYSLAELTAMTPGFDWSALMELMQVKGADSLLVNNPEFFKAADALFTAVPIGTWKAYLEGAIIKSAAPYLSSKFVYRQFEFNKVITGQKENTPRWQRVSGLTDRNLGELIGQLYVKKYFTPAAKERMLQLVKNVQETFAERIAKLDWMSDSTKDQALLKLNAIVNKIGFPDKWEKYEGVAINRDDFYGNMQSIYNYRYQKMVNRMGKPVDKTEWGMTPPTINAYYNPSNNEIAFPAGILQFPFFDFDADDAINYGGAGAVIGHELTHGFDDQGRQFAADGNLKDWWTADDAKKFTDRANKVVEQYNAYTVNDSIHVNGKLTLGENLADLGGLNIAYAAFKKTPQGKSNTKIDGFTPDQRFFLSWAQVWRSNILPESASQRILTDPHSPGMHRANGPVVNMDSWYKAFDVQPGDDLYKPEDERISIW